ncbi:hypothetical protein CBR_g26184 [Chara braunii]|uniref:Nudix hydrolase domain-containing protein n=1 Tax=Chara braunii TaxID=69332 RepID=A0A388L768_CHABU|nr:hypothetical protein CBR_g26184 [Chara braunii]|eukprot:GBG78149.1 hypothetical protein CBR_g26184 [Chara braunii]
MEDAGDGLAGAVTASSRLHMGDRSSVVEDCDAQIERMPSPLGPSESRAEEGEAEVVGRSPGEPSSRSAPTSPGEEGSDVDANTPNANRGGSLTCVMPKVGVGVAVLVVRDQSVIIGRRKGSHGTGTYALPGGHLDFGESWEECAIREVKEETGLDIANVRYAWVSNCVMLDEPKPCHYITLFMRAELRNVADEPENLEPDKCEEWQWVVWPRIPFPRFAPLQTLLDSPFSLF